MADVTVNIFNFDTPATGITVDVGSKIGSNDVDGNSTFTVTVTNNTTIQIKMVKAGYTTYDKQVRVYSSNITFDVYLTNSTSNFISKFNVIATPNAGKVDIYPAMANPNTVDYYFVLSVEHPSGESNPLKYSYSYPPQNGDTEFYAIEDGVSSLTLTVLNLSTSSSTDETVNTPSLTADVSEFSISQLV